MLVWASSRKLSGSLLPSDCCSWAVSSRQPSWSESVSQQSLQFVYAWGEGDLEYLLSFRDFLEPSMCLFPELNGLPSRMEWFIYLFWSTLLFHILSNILSLNKCPSKMRTKGLLILCLNKYLSKMRPKGILLDKFLHKQLQSNYGFKRWWGFFRMDMLKILWVCLHKYFHITMYSILIKQA